MLTDHDELLAEHHQLQDSCARLERDYATLEQAFTEISKLNSDLAADLHAAKQQRPAPVRYGSGLMGM